MDTPSLSPMRPESAASAAPTPNAVRPQRSLAPYAAVNNAGDNLGALDLNLLVVFTSVLKTRSTTLASDELELSQSAVSNALRRLRNHFGDPLFVKTAEGMSPTPLAQQLAGPIQEGLERIRSALDDRREFVPSTSHRRFHICMSDMGQLVLFPGLLAMAQVEAPGVCIATVEMPPREAHVLMARGELDLAIGTFPELAAGFHKQRLFTKQYVVMARAGNPALQGGLTLERFVNARHALFQPTADSHHTLEEHIDSVFRAHGAQRKVCAVFAHGLGIVEAVTISDLLVCVPKRLAELYAAQADIAVARLPFPSPVVDICQYWHERLHQDHGHRWLRSLLFRRFAD